MNRRFVGKRVFVTGASIGIGYEIARQFAAEGAIVGLNALTEDETVQAADKIADTPDGAVVDSFPGDISDVELIQDHIRTFADRHGGIDVMMANAGITVFAPFLKVQPREFDHLLGVNLRGTYFSVQEAARQMVQRETRGRIVLMSSVCGIVSHDWTSSYGMTKAGIRHLAISLSDELGRYGITVNAIAPGPIATERTMSDEQYDEGWAEVCPSGSVGHVEDVAHAVLFLADERSSQITGEVMVIDGGWSTTAPLPAYLKQQLR